LIYGKSDFSKPGLEKLSQTYRTFGGSKPGRKKISGLFFGFEERLGRASEKMMHCWVLTQDILQYFSNLQKSYRSPDALT
jgi:hypothetical protein